MRKVLHIKGPDFPSWIYTQNSLQSLDISSSGISMVDADMFRSFIAKDYRELDISNNSISEDLSNVTLNSTFLWLDHNNFTGGLPHILPKALQVDLSHNSFSGSIPYGWEYLKDLSFINLWSNKLFGEVLVNLSNLSQLLVLNLGKNEFSGAIPMMPQNLEVMILRSNQFEGNIPPQLFKLSSLYHMDLAYNKFSGSIPHCVYNMTQMIMNSNLTSYVPMTVDLFIKVVLFLFSSTTTSHISLTNNAHKVVRCNEKDRRILLMFKEGVIDDFDRLSTWSTEEDCCAWNGVECNNITHRVTKLDLQPRNSGFKNNQFTLKGNLSSLVSLSIGSNSLSGGISQTIFSNLPYLEDLDLSDLTFAFHFHPDFIPPFQLGRLDLSNTNQGPYFPSWIYTQKLLYYLDMSNTRISFIDEYKFRNLIAGIDDLHLSYNSISGDISNVTLNATEIYLDHNNFTASLPHISPNASHVDLSYNSFSGPIPCSWKNFKDLEFINLWSNQLSDSCLALSLISRIALLTCIGLAIFGVASSIVSLLFS
ncbi:hypothetical protein VNO77_42909 [Canavalia gladiata]|uniref:Leucine-rich repeat-containing N-terminal plant-type domain-containing protein n=1 Tax=Canavalia gladiata TaxID=3824 RepID=A0AAN9JVX8_CANGL